MPDPVPTSGSTPGPALGPGHGHIIVCGLDHIGARTVDELRRRDERVVAIAERIADDERLDALGVPVVEGDARTPAVLREAGVGAGAAAIVMTSSDDLANLNVALAAREIDPGVRVVLRMFDTELGAHIPELFPDGVALSSSALAAPGFVSAAIDGESGGRFELAGRILTARTSADPPRGTRSVPIARLGADRSVDMLPDPAAVVTDDGELIVIDIAMPGDHEPTDVPPTADASSSGPVLRGWAAFRDRLRAPEQRLFRFGTVLVLLATASALYFQVTANLGPLDAVSYAITLLTGAALPTSIDASAPDALRIYAIFLSLVGAAIVAIVYALITDALIRSRLLQTLGRRNVPGNIRDHVVVAGLGAIGYRVVLALQARGVPVVAIERQEDGRFVAAVRVAGIPVVIGDARQREVLDEVHVERARALVCATSDDLVNLSTALNGRAVRPDLRVVLRLFDPDFALRVQRGFGIRFTRSVSQLAAPAFAAAATRSEVVATVPVGDRRVALFARLRIPAGSALEGRLASDLDEPGARRVLAVADPGSDEARWDIPADEVLDADEEVVLVATRAGLGALLQLAATSAGAERTIADLPPADSDGRRATLPFDPREAVDAVRRGAGRAIKGLPQAVPAALTQAVPAALTQAVPAALSQALPPPLRRPAAAAPTTEWHIAQLNVGRAVALMDDPAMHGFVSRLDEINGLGEASPGFVWRLKTDSGNATDIHPTDDPRFIVNLTVWRSIDDLHAFTYRSEHKTVFKQRLDWFERHDGPNMVLWWLPAGTEPSLDDALVRLQHLAAHGPTPDAFTFKQRFPPPEASA